MELINRIIVYVLKKQSAIFYFVYFEWHYYISVCLILSMFLFLGGAAVRIVLSLSCFVLVGMFKLL